MLAICTNGAAMRPTKKMYMTRLPSVIDPFRIAPPPTDMITTPTEPTQSVENAVTADVPVIVAAMLRSNRWTPFVKVLSSRRSDT